MTASDPKTYWSRATAGETVTSSIISGFRIAKANSTDGEMYKSSLFLLHGRTFSLCLTIPLIVVPRERRAEIRLFRDKRGCFATRDCFARRDLATSFMVNVIEQATNRCHSANGYRLTVLDHSSSRSTQLLAGNTEEESVS
jgi:hypothetical protein